MNSQRDRKGGEACVRRADGTYSDAALHEELTAGVDDSDFRARTRAILLAAGLSEAALDRVLAPSPQRD